MVLRNVLRNVLRKVLRKVLHAHALATRLLAFHRGRVAPAPSPRADSSFHDAFARRALAHDRHQGTFPLLHHDGPHAAAPRNVVAFRLPHDALRVPQLPDAHALHDSG